MKDFAVLKLLDNFKGFFEKIDVDYEVMRKILQVKLTMDGRRTSSVMQGAQTDEKKKKKDGNNFYISLIFYGFMGLFLIPLATIGNSFIFQMGLVFTFIIFLSMTAFISDFSTVLLDVRDKGIILTKPVSGKTLSMAKTVHIVNYIVCIAMALCGPSLIATLAVHGVVFFIIYLIEIILINLLIISATALLYLGILKFFDGEKLKDIINYVQIGLSLFMVVGYQFMGRMFEFVDIMSNVKLEAYHLLLPPVWFAAPFELALKGETSLLYIIGSSLAIIVPILAIMVYVKSMPSFEHNLQKLTSFSSDVKVKKSLVEKIGNFLCRDDMERTFYKFANKMMSNERDFKLRVYPSLGFSIAFPFIMIFSIYVGDYASIGASQTYFTAYLTVAYLSMGLSLLCNSANYKAAWVYRVAPVKNLAPIYKGTLKAFIVKFLTPIYLVLAILFTFVFGVRCIPDLIGIYLASLFIIVIYFKLVGKELPFSVSFNDANKQSVAVMFMMLLVVGIVWGIHFTMTLLPFGTYMFIAIVVVLNIISWKTIFNKTYV